MPSFLKKWMLLLLGDYAIYFIYRRHGTSIVNDAVKLDSSFEILEVSEAAAAASSDLFLKSQVQYFGHEAVAFACIHNQQVVGLCFYWFGDLYKSRNFWPLAPDHAKLVQIVTRADMQGRGIAGHLISRSSLTMMSRGFRSLYARVWHSNKPSWRAFSRSGWTRIALAVEINPFRSTRPLRFFVGRQPPGSNEKRQI